MAATIGLDQLLASPSGAISQLYAALGTPQADAAFDAAPAMQQIMANAEELRAKARRPPLCPLVPTACTPRMARSPRLSLPAPQIPALTASNAEFLGNGTLVRYRAMVGAPSRAPLDA